MSLKKCFAVGVIALLSACTSTEGLETQIASFSQQVDKLTTEVSKLKNQQNKTNTAMAELKSADETTNQRIDNVAASFKK